MDECKPLIAGRMYINLPYAREVGLVGKGLHSFTFQLNVSTFCGIGGAFRGRLGVFRGCLGCVAVSETAQVELRSGRV